MDRNFQVDVPRLTIFFDQEWIPSDEPDTVWEEILELYNYNECLTTRAAYYCTQAAIADAYIEEASNLPPDEHLISGQNQRHHVIFSRLDRTVTVRKELSHSYIHDGETYHTDMCSLTIIYDPLIDKELLCDWRYHIKQVITPREFSTDILRVGHLEDIK